MGSSIVGHFPNRGAFVPDLVSGVIGLVLEPYHYLRRIFTDLPRARTLEDLEALLPMNLTSDPTLRRSGS